MIRTLLVALGGCAAGWASGWVGLVLLLPPMEFGTTVEPPPPGVVEVGVTGVLAALIPVGTLVVAWRQQRLVVGAAALAAGAVAFLVPLAVLGGLWG